MARAMTRKTGREHDEGEGGDDDVGQAFGAGVGGVGGGDGDEQRAHVTAGSPRSGFHWI